MWLIIAATAVDFPDPFTPYQDHAAPQADLLEHLRQFRSRRFFTSDGRPGRRTPPYRAGSLSGTAPPRHHSDREIRSFLLGELFPLPGVMICSSANFQRSPA